MVLRAFNTCFLAIAGLTLFQSSSASIALAEDCCVFQYFVSGTEPPVAVGEPVGHYEGQGNIMRHASVGHVLKCVTKKKCDENEACVKTSAGLWGALGYWCDCEEKGEVLSSEFHESSSATNISNKIDKYEQFLASAMAAGDLEEVAYIEQLIDALEKQLEALNSPVTDTSAESGKLK